MDVRRQRIRLRITTFFPAAVRRRHHCDPAAGRSGFHLEAGFRRETARPSICEEVGRPWLAGARSVWRVDFDGFVLCTHQSSEEVSSKQTHFLYKQFTQCIRSKKEHVCREVACRQKLQAGHCQLLHADSRRGAQSWL